MPVRSKKHHKFPTVIISSLLILLMIIWHQCLPEYAVTTTFFILIRGLERQPEDKQYNILITIVIRWEDFIMESRIWPYMTSYNEDSASPLMTVPELAEYLGVGRNAVYHLLRDGSIQGFRIGSSWKASREAVDLFIRKKSGMV